MKYDFIIHDPAGAHVLLIKHLFHWRGWRINLHKIVQADAPNCFHTHPAKAWRLILWGGYVEEIMVDFPGEGHFTYNKFWTPGMFGRIEPVFEHRIGAVLNGKCSYSLWLRGPVTDAINTRGC